jgi:hypothetical protein
MRGMEAPRAINFAVIAHAPGAPILHRKWILDHVEIIAMNEVKDLQMTAH